MSHFTTLVAIDDVANLDEALAPFDENKRVPPYKEYEKGGPTKFWAAPSLESEGKIKIDNDLTWEQVAEAYNTEGMNEEEVLHVDDDGHAYTLNTYNPKSKWDWWSIGGRWTGYFPIVPGHENEIVTGDPGLQTPAAKPGFCDGGPKRALDLARMRDEKEAQGRETYREYKELVKDTPPAKPWRDFIGLIDDDKENSHYTPQMARTDYHGQERVAKIRDSKFDFHFGSDAIETFDELTEDEYAAECRAAAVPGYSVLTKDGKWLAPGKMGWFGTSSDDRETRAEYYKEANDYIDSLPDDAVLVLLDLHI